MRGFHVVMLAFLVVAGCSASLGPVGLLAPEPDAVGIKMLRPGVVGRSCRVSVFGLPLSPGEPELRGVLAQLLALDPEANLVRNAEVSWQRLVTGVYNRRCVEVRGDLARSVTTLALPAHPGHGGHSHH